MMRVHFFLLTISILLVSSSSTAARMAFLKVDVGARAAGMGGAFVAAGDDISSIWSNPAGLSMIKTEEIAFHHQDWLQDTRYECFAYAYPAKNLSLGVSLNHLSSNHIPEVLRDTNDNPLPTNRLFDVSDMSGMFVISKQVSKNMSIGSGFKYLQEQLDNNTAHAGALDLGCLYTPNNSLCLALSIQNIGYRIQMDKDEFTLPLMYRTGAAWKNEVACFGIELNKARNRELRGCAGIELRINNPITLRCGYQFLTDNEHGSFKDMPEKLSLGFGVKIGRTIMDYAFAPYGVLEDTHRVSISTKFGQQRVAAKKHVPIEKEGFVQEDERIEKNVSGDTVIVTTNNAPLREGPGTDYPVITRVKIETRLMVVDKQKKMFYKVVLPDGTCGWICSIFVE
ncbi:MAG: PorV/PorQ family protein [bacterium]|nr:PorV/PorQ family protein [bacterium]